MEYKTRRSPLFSACGLNCGLCPDYALNTPNIPMANSNASVARVKDFRRHTSLAGFYRAASVYTRRDHE